MTEIVGILNVTPDSFSDGGLYIDPSEAFRRADEMFEQGASIVDVGAESTRPGAAPLSPDQEWQRLEPVLPTLLTKYVGRISLDSYHPETFARVSPRSVIMNDVLSFSNPRMREIAAATRSRCIVSHIPGFVGQDIRAGHKSDKKVNSAQQVLDDLLTNVGKMLDSGIHREDIILDPGIGFVKTTRLNWKLLEFAAMVPEYPVMIGYSNKSFIGRDPKVNLGAGVRAIESGARYLRVHDVAGHAELLRTYDKH